MPQASHDHDLLELLMTTVMIKSVDSGLWELDGPGEIPEAGERTNRKATEGLRNHSSPSPCQLDPLLVIAKDVG